MNPIDQLLAEIHQLEDKTQQDAVEVGISTTRARPLLGMKVSDWYEAGHGFTSHAQCEAITAKFFSQGAMAADGLILSARGTVLRTRMPAQIDDAGGLVILIGRPRVEPKFSEGEAVFGSFNGEEIIGNVSKVSWDAPSGRYFYELSVADHKGNINYRPNYAAEDDLRRA